MFVVVDVVIDFLLRFGKSKSSTKTTTSQDIYISDWKMRRALVTKPTADNESRSQSIIVRGSLFAH